jgi:hypothetical protein
MFQRVEPTQEPKSSPAVIVPKVEVNDLNHPMDRKPHILAGPKRIGMDTQSKGEAQTHAVPHEKVQARAIMGKRIADYQHVR